MYCWFSELNLAIEEVGGGWDGERGPGEKQRGARKAGLLVLLAFFSIIQLCLLSLKVCVTVGFAKQSASLL